MTTRKHVTHAGLISDCSIYYRAIYESLKQAEKSVFIVGWDIDSRIALLRGDDMPDPSVSWRFSDILERKARENPDMTFYLNKWDPSLLYAREREPLATMKWHTKMPDNVHVVLDDAITSGGSHHQKIIVIDDRVAFCGGMDIALNRWDTPDHWPDEPLRDGPLGKYAPYHDFQLVLEGEIVEELAAQARWRWQRATGFDATEWSPGGNDVWPSNVGRDMSGFEAEIAYTFPGMADVENTRQIEKTLHRDIRSAEKFLYIENQYLAWDPIARTINEELKKKPDLRVLIVSSFNPQGPLEKETMWQGRLAFRNLVENEIGRERVRMVYPVSRRSDGSEEAIRIHAKLMIVDDRIIRVGSANINGRSMGHDSECDIICHARTHEHRDTIRKKRNEYISHFAGTTVTGDDFSFDALLNADEGTHLALREIDDRRFADHVLGPLIRKLGDRATPTLPDEIDPKAYASENTPPWKRHMYKAIAGAILVLLFSALWFVFHEPGRIEWIRANIEILLASGDHPAVAIVLVTVLFTLLTLLSFPVTVLIALTASVYGPLLGFVYALIAGLVSGAVGFGLGALTGRKFLRGVFGPRLQKINERVGGAGVLQLAILRMVPIAPYGVFNVVSGVSAVRLGPFMAGTLLGMLPGTFALAVLGDSLAAVFTEARPETVGYLIFAIALWIGVVLLMHKFVKSLQNRKPQEIR
ncbi:MAG: hypothetical protein EOM26_09550 [Alphaproteobacteria bacterium]|nr:hypothetical protein [Alphaproteobacteria bacterium]